MPAKTNPATIQISTFPRGLRLDAAAAYVGVSVSTFERWVERGLMPKPKKIDGITVWDRRKIDQSFDDLPGDTDDGRWDDVAA